MQNTHAIFHRTGTNNPIWEPIQTYIWGPKICPIWGPIWSQIAKTILWQNKYINKAKGKSLLGIYIYTFTMEKNIKVQGSKNKPII